MNWIVSLKIGWFLLGRLPTEEDDEVALRRVGGQPLLDQGDKVKRSQYFVSDVDEKVCAEK